MKYCNWEYVECIKPYRKWLVKLDCGHEVILTRENKYGRIAKKSWQPHPQGTDPGAKCPHCGKEVNTYSERDERTWRIEE